MNIIYNDASLMQLDDLIEEYSALDTTDERREELEPLMLGLAEQKEQRIVELRKIYVNAEADEAALKPILERLTTQRSLAKKKQETCKRLTNHLVKKGDKIKLPDGGAISWRLSTQTIVDLKVLPAQWRKLGDAKLTEIKEEIERGGEVPGAYLDTDKRIQIK